MEIQGRYEASQTEAGLYQRLVDAIADYAIYMLDGSGTVTSWNTGAQRFKGYQASEIVGQHFSVFYTEEDRRSGLPAHALEVAASTGTFEGEGWRVRKDGSQFWAHVVIDPIRLENGGLVGFAKITRDLTERQAAKEALRHSEQEFRLLVQSVTDYAVYMLDARGHVSNWNTGAQRIKGYLPHEIIGKHFSMFYTAEDKAKGEPQRALDIAAREGRFEKEGWRVRKDGNVFWANVVIDRIIGDDGAIIGFAKITRDMTQAREAQISLERARDSLFQSQKMEAIGQLTGGVAHDFNNLLTVVLGGLEILQSRLPPDPNITPLLENAIQAAHRGSMLTQRMLAFARRQDLKPETVDLSALVHGMSDLLQRSLGPTVMIEIQFPRFLDPVRVDPNQLELAILNLAMNGRDAMPNGGSIIIAARPETSLSDHDGEPSFDRHICLTVADRGEGMDEATLSRAMEPFFTTKDVGKGTGLGLSMVHGLAEQSGGHFSLKSRKGEGTVAELLLPIAVDAIRITALPGSDKRSFPLGLNGRPLAVLAVDHDRLALMNTTAMLNDMSYRTFAATSGEQALDILRREKIIDLVIIDHAMPDMSGAELADAIKAEFPMMPMIFATPLAAKSLQSVAKPLRPEDLGRAIARIQIPHQDRVLV